jgi:hypothetical protein
MQKEYQIENNNVIVVLVVYGTNGQLDQIE